MTDTLLSRSEVTACKKLTASDGLPAARARALLALHDQRTQAQAAEASGLTVGQVRYALSTFKRKGMGLFEDAATTTSSSATRSKAVSVKGKADKAGKSDKKSQKAKSDKKDKKSAKMKKAEAKDKKSGKSKKDKSAKKKKKSGKKK